MQNPLSHLLPLIASAVDSIAHPDKTLPERQNIRAFYAELLRSILVIVEWVYNKKKPNPKPETSWEIKIQDNITKFIILIRIISGHHDFQKLEESCVCLLGKKHPCKLIFTIFSSLSCIYIAHYVTVKKSSSLPLLFSPFTSFIFFPRKRYR